jgi:GAF domain-containing protein
MSTASYPLPPNETERLEALRRYRVLDTEREKSFDEISKLAAFICKTPIASVTLVDADRQWFKSIVGLEATETPRDLSFCTHTILDTGVMVVEDASKDDRFAGNPFVTGNPHVRFYAGAPLTTHDDFAIGALCVIDSVPRVLSPDERSALISLSHLVMTQLELRMLSADLADSLREVKALRDILPTCSYCKNIRNEKGEWDNLEHYIMDETATRFSHGICPTCAKIHFPGFEPGAKKPPQ